MAPKPKAPSAEEDLLIQVMAEQLSSGDPLLLADLDHLGIGRVIASARVCDDGVTVGRTRYYAGLTPIDLHRMLGAYQGFAEPPPWWNPKDYDRRH